MLVFNKDYMNLKCYYRVVEFKSGWKSIKKLTYTYLSSTHTVSYTRVCIRETEHFEERIDEHFHLSTVVIRRKHNPFFHESPTNSMDFFPFIPMRDVSESFSDKWIVHFPLWKFAATMEMSTFVLVRHAFVTHMRIAVPYICRSPFTFMQHFGVYCVVIANRGTIDIFGRPTPLVATM